MGAITDVRRGRSQRSASTSGQEPAGADGALLTSGLTLETDHCLGQLPEAGYAALLDAALEHESRAAPKTDGHDPSTGSLLLLDDEEEGAASEGDEGSVATSDWPRRLRNLGRVVITVLVAALAAGSAVIAVLVFSLHLGIRPVLSGSMQPTFDPGWAIITRPIPVSELHKGMVVVFTPPGKGAPYAHRIVSVTGSKNGPVITTKGDFNKQIDPWRARLTGKTIPEVVGAVPWFGNVLVDLQHRAIKLSLIILGGLAVAVFGVLAILRPRDDGAPLD
jgi:signal peptidase I